MITPLFKKVLGLCFGCCVCTHVIASPVCDLYQRCLTEINSKRYQEAIQLFEAGDQQQAVIVLGEVYHESEPNQLLANNYAVMLAATGQPIEAALVLEHYLQQDPAVANIAQNLVKSYDNLNLLGTDAAKLAKPLQLLKPDALLAAGLNVAGSNDINIAGQPQGLDTNFDSNHSLNASTSNLSQFDTVAPELVSASSSISLIEARLDQFLAAWSAGDSEQYLQFFVPQQSPVAGLSYQGWRQQRLQRVKPSKNIVVTAENLQFDINGEQVISRFLQRYQSNHYQDSVLKEVTWQLHHDQWLIAAEREIKP